VFVFLLFVPRVQRLAGITEIDGNLSEKALMQQAQKP